MRKIRRNLIYGRGLRERINAVPVGSPIDVSKMHGHMSLTLTDVKTGKKEVIEEDNMMTNALQKYFANMGFLNFPNVNQSNMVEELLGGVLGFNDVISENANIIHAPAGLKMTFNGSVGTVNNGNPTELGSYSSTESGWQQDGSYVQTYDFSTSQANGTIACVCLTGKNYGFIGEGNSTSLTRRSSGVDGFNLRGSTTTYSVLGSIYHVDLTDSSCYSFRIEEFEEEEGGETVTVKKGVIRKYRLPFSKVNIKGTVANPIILSETVITIDEELKNARIMTFPHDGKLLLWNIHESSNIWGTNWTQYLWTVTTSGISRQTVTNTSGEELNGLQAAYFDGNYCFFLKTYPDLTSEKIYIWNRTNNSISVVDNPTGGGSGHSTSWTAAMGTAGWDIVHGTGNGRITTSGSYPMVVDAVLKAAYPINPYTTNLYHWHEGGNNLVYYIGSTFYRGQSYIASINNLDNPVVKTSDKTMKVVYRITFDEQ